MEMRSHLAESTEDDVHIFFRRPRKEALRHAKQNEVYVTFYSPRQGAPTKLAPNHFRFAASKRSIYQHIVALLKVVEYELTHKKVTVHFG